MSFQWEVTQINRKLKPRERLFCGYFAATGDAALSAKQAGYKGDCHYCPKGHTHSLINNSDEDLVFFAVVPVQ